MNLLTVSLASALSCSSSLAHASSQAQVNVGIVASEPWDTCLFLDVRDKLLSTDVGIGQVELFDAHEGTPTSDWLQARDAVLVWSDLEFDDGVALGNALADYVDLGGGVVVAVRCSTATVNYWQLGGRWTQGYEAIVSGSGLMIGPAAMGALHVPGHPVLEGVGGFLGGMWSFRPGATVLTPGSVRIADWDDGRALVVEGPKAGIVELGFYPPSSQCGNFFWNQQTGGALLLANALVHAANPPLGESYCVSSVNSTGGAAEIRASGTVSVASNSFRLHAAPVPDQPGLFFYGPDQVLVPFGNGFRCVGGVVGRLGIEVGIAGELETTVDFETPPSAAVAVVGGSTWHFQGWFRDPAAGGAGFDLSDGMTVLFLP